MALLDTIIKGVIGRVLPNPVADGSEQRLRMTRYGDGYNKILFPGKHTHADEGGYFVCTNPTPGTKIDYGSAGTQAAFSDTVPFMIVKNNDNGASLGKRIYLDYIKLIQIGGTAPATTTSVHYAIKVDSKNRDNTAGTMTAITPVNPNSDSTMQSLGQLLVPAGAVATVPAASPAARLVARGQLKGGPTLVLDEYTISFGLADTAPEGGYLTTVAAYTTRSGPVIVGPGQNAVIYLWLPGAATNPFSFEFEVGWIER